MDKHKLKKIRFVLALDTAMAGCSVALYDREADALFSESASMPRGQSEALVPMVQRVMGQAGEEFSSIDTIVTTVGPGAFTGLRIGLSTARALGQALDRPVYGVTTLAAIAAAVFQARGFEPEDVLCVLLETKRVDFYVQFFDAQGAPLSEAVALGADDILAQIKEIGARVILAGDAPDRFLSLCSEEKFSYEIAKGFELPDPCVMARMSSDTFLAPDPVYLRGADVSMPKKKMRVLCD